MEPNYPAGSGTVAAIGRHPLHPMLVPLPIGFLVGALLSDIAYASTEDAFWARASFWLLVGGIATGVVAGLLGLIDLLGIQRARNLRIGWLHGLGNILAILVAIANVALRWTDAAAPIWGTGLFLSAIITVILLVTGWLGGELSYRHGIGVSPLIGRAEPEDSRNS